MNNKIPIMDLEDAMRADNDRLRGVLKDLLEVFTECIDTTEHDLEGHDGANCALCQARKATEWRGNVTRRMSSAGNR